MADFMEQARKVSAITGIPLNETDAKIPLRKKKEKPKPTFGKPENIEGNVNSELLQYASYCLLEDKRAAAALEMMHKRGFTDEMIVDNCIGWVPRPSKVLPEWGHARRYTNGYICIPFPENGNWCTGKDFCQVKRITVRPVATQEEIAREEPKFIKERKQKGAKYPLYREYLLYTEPVVWITESPFDAIAGKELLGKEMAALCGLGCNRLFQILYAMPEDERPEIIMALDNDRAGIDAACEAEKTLRSMGVKASAFNNAMSERRLGIYGLGRKCKDFNDLLRYNSNLKRPRDYKC